MGEDTAKQVTKKRSGYAAKDREAKLSAREKKSLILLEMTLMWNTLKTNGINKIVYALGISIVLNLGMFILIFLLAFRSPEVRVITTNAAGQVVEIPNVSMAMYDDASAKRYALEAITHLFTLHQDNYKRELEEATERYMVPGGREIFYQGLDSMQILAFLNDVRKHPGATVSINTAVGPTITLTSELDEGMGRHAWNFTVPAAITISDGINKSSTSQYTFRVKLVRLTLNEKADGIGVMKIIGSKV